MLARKRVCTLERALGRASLPKPDAWRGVASARGRGQANPPNQPQLPVTSRTIFSQGSLPFRGGAWRGRALPPVCTRVRSPATAVQTCWDTTTPGGEDTGILSGISSSPQQGTCCPSDK